MDAQRFTAVCRLTREPEFVAFNNGGGVAKLSVAFTGKRKKNPQTGQWESDPCYLDCQAFNGEHRKLATVVMDFCGKGTQVFIAGNLIMDRWQDKQTNQNRQVIKLEIDEILVLDRKKQGQGNQGNGQGGYAQQPQGGYQQPQQGGYAQQPPQGYQQPGGYNQPYQTPAAGPAYNGGSYQPPMDYGDPNYPTQPLNPDDIPF